MFGLSTALHLQKNGYKCILLEARQIGSGSSGNTQGILTSARNTIYSTLESKLGCDGLKNYASFGQLGINTIKQNISDYNINCDFKEIDFYTYATTEQEFETLKKEKTISLKAQIPASIETSNCIPESESFIDMFGALKIADQAQFDAIAYMFGIAKAFTKLGGEIYENSRVIDVKDDCDPIKVILENQSIVHSEYVVCATHLPILDRSGHFALVTPIANYMVQLPLANPIQTKSVYSPLDSTSFDSKTISWSKDGKNVIIVGYPHRLGELDKVKKINPFEELTKFAKKYLNVADDAKPKTFFDFDYTTGDQLPFIGYLNSNTKNIFMATGFNLWGLAFSAAAPIHIYSLIKGQQSPYDIFNSTRMVLKEFISNQGNVVKHFIGDRVKNFLHDSSDDANKLKPGEAGIHMYDGKARGCYKNLNGELTVVDLECQHLNCQTTFNPFANTYDCSCHGSRYNLQGEVLSAPSVKPLKTVTIPLTDQDQQQVEQQVQQEKTKIDQEEEIH